MRLAIAAARDGIAAGQSPFGCAIARGDELVAVAHNTVVSTPDVTAHAEINALRLACRTLNQVHLVDCLVATTCEPCPMCMAALHWARVKDVYYGAGIADAERAGFNELKLPAADVLQRGASRVRLIPDLLASECRALFAEWLAVPSRQTY
jgi:guanine deaminase